MKTVIRPVMSLMMIVCVGCGHPSNPLDAQIVTSDVDHFWEAFDGFVETGDPQTFQEAYIDKGSQGLDGFMEYRIVGAEELGTTVQKQLDYYRSARQPLQHIADQEAAIRRSFFRLQSYYPKAVFPDVYFVIGRMNSGGTTSRHGLIIGAEMYGLTPAYARDSLSAWHQSVLRPPSDLSRIVAHELIHFQQPFSIRAKLSPTLLYEAIREGGADFVGELISGGHINDVAHAYANPREKELWEEFRGVMMEDDLSEWIANGGESGDRPADLGYWMGYKIVEWYYTNADDKVQALDDIINMKDAKSFLEMSGYATKRKS